MSIQTSDFHDALLDRDSLASYSSEYVGRHSLLVSKGKRSLERCFGGFGANGSGITLFNPLDAQRYMLYIQGFFSSSVRQ